MNNAIQDYLSNDFGNYLPSISVDCVIIGYQQNNLTVLVLQWKGTNLWSLPGGFVNKEESIDQAAYRVLKDRTGLDISYLKQLHVFGNVERRDISVLHSQLGKMKISNQIMKWLDQRFISVSYIALVNPNSFVPIPDSLSALCEWKPINNLPKLLFDHQQMIEKAQKYMKLQIRYQPIGLSLLPRKFTMKMLQNLYEVILDTILDRGNFQKKMIKLGVLNRLEKQMKGSAHKAPYLYSFNVEKYQLLLERGIGFI